MSDLDAQVEALAAVIPERRYLSKESVDSWCSSKQNKAKGIALLSSAAVTGISSSRVRAEDGSSFTRIVGYVESEKTVGQWYRVELSARGSGSNTTWSSLCTCIARNNDSKCKHACALCYACVAVRDHRKEKEYPEKFKRVGIKRFQTSPTNPLRESQFWKEARIDLSWPEVIAASVKPVPLEFVTAGGSKRKPKLVEQPNKKRRRVKLYCYCQKEDDKSREFVECSAKLSACKQWYHIDCLEKKEGVKLERTKGGRVRGDVVCVLCQALKSVGAK